MINPCTIVPRKFKVGTVVNVVPSRFADSGEAVIVSHHDWDMNYNVLYDLEDFHEKPEICQKVRIGSYNELCEPSECRGVSLKVVSVTGTEIKGRVMEDFELRRLAGAEVEAETIGSTLTLDLNDFLPHVPLVGETIYFNRVTIAIVDKSC